MRKDSIRNVAIIAHVDHGKTTLVEGLLTQSGTFKAHQEIEDRVMDSMDLEKERGITITAKNTAVFYNDVKINILDTPGHKDFCEDTYRTLTAVDSVIMVIDSTKGVEEQTYKIMEVCRMTDTPIITFINNNCIFFFS